MTPAGTDSRPGSSPASGQHLSFEIEQIVGSLTKPRIRQTSQRIDVRAYGATPRIAGTATLSDPLHGRCPQLGVVKKLEVRRDDGALSAAPRPGERFEMAAHGIDCRVQCTRLVIDSLAGLGDLALDAPEDKRRAHRDSRRRDHASHFVARLECYNGSWSRRRREHGGAARNRRLRGVLAAFAQQALDGVDRGCPITPARLEDDFIAGDDTERQQGNRAAGARAAVVRAKCDLGARLAYRAYDQRGRARMNAVRKSDPNAAKNGRCFVRDCRMLRDAWRIGRASLCFMTPRRVADGPELEQQLTDLHSPRS